ADCGATDSTCTVTLDQARFVEASFVATVNLSVNKTGSGTGTVTSSPTGINCGSSCSGTFDQDASVTLTAAADSGSRFTGWSGDVAAGCTTSTTRPRSP
ncbi:MAG: InlB B-repeat-containing protein, partial [Solirubrobacterales bacterium]